MQDSLTEDIEQIISEVTAKDSHVLCCEVIWQNENTYSRGKDWLEVKAQLKWAMANSHSQASIVVRH